MTRSQLVAAAILVTQAVVAYALTQPDFVLPPIAKFVLGALSVGLNAIALFLKLQPPGPTLTVPGGAEPVIGDGKP